jgi:hypothetical protein
MEFSTFGDSPFKTRRSMSLAANEDETAIQQFMQEMLTN